MTTDGGFERAGILARAQAYLLGGRVYDFLPDDKQLEKGANGRPKPYAVIHYGTIYASPDARSITGEEDQPHIFPFSVACYATTAEAAQSVAGAVRKLFIGWAPGPGSEEIHAPGGLSFRDRDATAAPTLAVEVVALETVINVGSNDGMVPSPGHAPGGEPTLTIEQIVEAYLLSHRLSYERHDFPIPVGQWSMVHALGRIPSVTLYSLDGERLLSDLNATDASVVVTWANPTAGFAILN